MARVLRRLDATARSFIAVIDEGSCFSGSLLELALAADRSYMLEDEGGKVVVHASVLNGGAFPMSHGPTRLKARHLDKLPASGAALTAPEADKAGLVTIIADDIDFPDEVRVAVEERVSLSPDALTGMEANLRFVGAETLETKIFGRLSAWQNWIFIRDNATGDTGALTLYGRPERPQFDWKRT
jgi:benzoyl-CoA-dihydrodiol lyase